VDDALDLESARVVLILGLRAVLEAADLARETSTREGERAEL
jgi:hypothetical protein